MALKSPEFSSPTGRNPKTVWWMEVYPHQVSSPKNVPVEKVNSNKQHVYSEDYVGIRLFLKSCAELEKRGCWTTAEFSETHTQARVPWESDPKKLFKGDDISYDQLARMSSGSVYGSIKITCRITVYLFDDPKHSGTRPISPVISIPKHSLGKVMEEARQSGLLTDVTLFAGKDEFKAHRVVLAAQSPFFKSCFEQCSGKTDSRVELVSDISPEVLETVLKYMYTGKVDKIDDLAYNLLSTADEYGLENLQRTCEATLAKNLSAQTVVDVLILAETHGANDLKKVCMDFIVKNPSQVQMSSAWLKLQGTKISGKIERLRIEVLEACFKSLC